MRDDMFSKGVSLLAKLIGNRIEAYGEEFLYFSQESLMTFLYMCSLVLQNPEILDKIFIDYPFSKQAGSRGKFDIYIDIDPGYYVEVKYVRPIPSGMNIPLPQHRGSLINDLTRLISRTSIKSHKYLLLVASKEFITHIVNKPGFPLMEATWRGSIRSLIVTKTEENRIAAENRGFLYREIEIRRLNYEVIRPLHIVLWKVVPI